MKLRASNLDRLSEGVFDALVIGSGINGAVSAAALAGKGARVALIDRGDFGGLTSQESSNLVWGGIKYLESFELALVAKLCKSRNHLIRSYPSTVREIRFLTAHERGFRHGLLKLLLGTWLYWLIGRCFTRRPRLLSTAAVAAEEPIIDVSRLDGGFEYSDAYLRDNDARFVWNFVRAALDHGCVAANYVESLGATRRNGEWHVRARDVVAGREVIIRARVLVNACGPYVDAHNALTAQRTQARHVFSKGIHLIVDRLTPRERVLTFFADDGRLFFVIPMGNRTCIGTTDTKVDAPEATVTPDDRAFVLSNINKRLSLESPLTEADVLAERCGVRPLAMTGEGEVADFLQLSRKHVVEVDEANAHVSIFGGKLTDCLNVGEEIAAVVRRLGVVLPQPRRRWYGEPSDDVRDEFFYRANGLGLDELTSPRSSEPLSTRLWRRYGERAFELLDEIRMDRDMAAILIEGAEYIRCELVHAARHEMITKLDDFLRRRSKIALVTHTAAMVRAPGLFDACRILFENEADAKLAEYLASEVTAAQTENV